MAFNTGAGSKLIAPGIRKVLFQGYNERTKEYEAIFNTSTSTRTYEEDVEFVGLGVMAEKAQGNPIIYADPTQGGTKRYTHTSFGGGYRVTREMMDDDLYGVTRAQKMSKELGKGARVVREIRAANVFNNGFGTADGFPKNGSTQTLFNTAHTLVGSGGTLSNSAGATDLAQSSLEAAIIAFNQLTDENGVPIVVIPKILLVPAGIMMVARELLGSEFKPYTANNEINPVKQDGLSLMVNHYLTDTDAWFVLADKSDHDLNFITRTDLEFGYGDDFDTGDMKVKAFQRFSVGYGDWRGVYGAQGV